MCVTDRHDMTAVKVALNLYTTNQWKHLLQYVKQGLTLSQTERVADDNFKGDENFGVLSKRVDNTLGKGKIARYEQFLLSPQCFQKTGNADTLKPGLVWERVK